MRNATKAVPIVFKELQAGDVKMYLEGTYVRAVMQPTILDSQWVALTNIGETGGNVAMVYPEMGQKFLANLSAAAVKLDLTWPESGYYNYKDGVMLYGRRMRRQYKKALCPETVVINPLISKYVALGIFPAEYAAKGKFVWGVKEIAALFNSPEAAFQKAFSEVKDVRTYARAINKDIAIGMGITDGNPALWFRDIYVGRVVGPKEIKLKSPEFGQEIADSLRDSGNIGIQISCD